MCAATPRPRPAPAIAPARPCPKQPPAHPTAHACPRPHRAAERRPEIIASLQRAGGYERVVDLSSHEGKGQYFEGTGEERSCEQDAMAVQGALGSGREGWRRWD